MSIPPTRQLLELILLLTVICNKCGIFRIICYVLIISHAVSPTGNVIQELSLLTFPSCCKSCLEQYISSAVDFKSHFKINKHNINTNKDRCRTVKHFNGKCKDSDDLFLSVRITTQVYENTKDMDEFLWYRDKYCQSQFSTTHMT